MKSLNNALLILATIMILTGCTDQSTPQSHEEGVKEITVKLSNFKITPSSITVDEGDRVRLNVVNVEGEHNLFISGYDLRTDITSAGESRIIEFTTKKDGTFDMWCEVRDHKSRGMKGQLIVR
jgi:plastocyanin